MVVDTISSKLLELFTVSQGWQINELGKIWAFEAARNIFR